jgi:hypothetical protein
MKANLHTVLQCLFLAILIAAPRSLRAQGPPPTATTYLANSATSVASGVTSNPASAASGATPGNVDPSTLVMIENRARVFGNQTSASGTRYFAVTDSDLVGKTPAQTMQLLSPPPVPANGGVHAVEIVIDLRHPLTLYTDGSEPNIGTAVIQGSSSARPIEVDSYIFGVDLTVMNGRP